MVAARKRPKEENPIQEAVEADRPATPRPRATRPLGMRPQRDDVAPLPETGSSFYTPSSPAQMQQAAQHVMNARAGVDDSGSPLRPSY